MKEELFPLLKEHMLEVVIPHHQQLILGYNENRRGDVDCDTVQNKDIKAILEQIIEKVAEQPEKV